MPPYKNGLSSKEVQEKKEKYGKNVLPEEKAVPAIRLFLGQFANPLVYILALAGLISLALGKLVDIAIIFSVVILNAFMGFFQENKTQKTLIALKRLVKPKARVIRDGEKQEVEASELVPGDIVFLSSGDRVSADGRILEAVSFLVNEAILTGESEAVEKKVEDEVFMGTVILSGHATIKVEKIGKATKIGEIAETLRETEEPETTLQVRLKKLTRSLIYLSIFLSLVVFVVGFLTGRDVWEMAELSAILLVAIIPEALLIVITLVLVLAMRDSLKRKALIRKILAVETLGSVTTICTDKTGTLTEGKMRITEAEFADEKRGLLSMCLCNNQEDTLEIALWEYLKGRKDFDPEKLSRSYERVFEIPFSSRHKFMATVDVSCSECQDHVLLVKGAPEAVLGMAKISEKEKEAIMEKVDAWARQGLKVLALASRDISEAEVEKLSIESLGELSFAGLVGLWDPPRREAKETLEVARSSGLKVKVVTGDYHETAVKVMENLGIAVRPEEILQGKEIENLSDEALRERVLSSILFARVTPQQKLEIVRIFQEAGEVVAMTGDGVNDAPALKKSNIGIVVGDASEVAKETADLILLDNNFKTIVAAVESGRLVFENIKKILLFILSNSFAEIVVILGALILGWPFPLTVVQILWLHLLCDGPEDFILGFEPKERETMLEGPKKMDEPLLGKLSLFLIVTISLLSGTISLGFYWFFGIRGGDPLMGSTMAFMSLAWSSVIYIFSCRTLRKPFWRYENFWKNKGLFAVVLLSLFLAVVITYFPPTQRLLGLAPLHTIHWLLLLGKGVLLVAIIELAKLKFHSNGEGK